MRGQGLRPGLPPGAPVVGGQTAGAGMLAPVEEEIVCSQIVFDDFVGRVICADDGTILAENVIDDDVELDHVVLPRFVPYLRRR